jgi:Transposase
VQRRIVGLDLGVASDHTAVVLDETGAELARRRVRPVRASLEALRQAALAGAETGTVVEVVIEPTGPAWLPVAVFFAATGDVVYRVSSQKAADLRRYFRRHHKTNRIDATTLARIAILQGQALRPVELARGLAAELDREVRVTERLTEEIAARKVRIRDLARQLMPTSGRAFSATIAHTDLEILRAWGDPRALVAQGIQALAEFAATVSRGRHGHAKAAAWIAAATDAVELYGTTDAVPFAALAADLATEIALLTALEAARAPTRVGVNSSTSGSIPTPWPARCPASPKRAGAGHRHRRPRRALPKRRPVRLLHRPGPRRLGDRRDRPQRPSHHQGRQPQAAPDALPRRRHRPQARPAAGPHLLRPDGQAGRQPHQGPGGRGRAPGQTAVAGTPTPEPLRRLRHRRHPGRSRPGQSDHRRALHRARGDPPASTVQEEDGEGPQQVRTGHARNGAPGASTRRPSPTPILDGAST